jgi:hypothetical protein
MISIYPFGDEYYTFTESPIIHRIDPHSLETLDRVILYNTLIFPETNFLLNIKKYFNVNECFT